jgi:hypothetical protein
MTDRERRISELPPELQQVFGLLDAKVAQIEQRRERKSVWKRIGKIALWWCAIMGALNMIGMAFLLLDKMMQ